VYEASPSVPRSTVFGVRKRLYTLDEVAETLNVSWSQAYALVTSRDLPGIQIGGRHQWRVDPARLEAWLDAKHEQTARGRAARRPAVADVAPDGQ
jgi:excisionase family DNA binding protein